MVSSSVSSIRPGSDLFVVNAVFSTRMRRLGLRLQSSELLEHPVPERVQGRGDVVEAVALGELHGVAEPVVEPSDDPEAV